MLTDTHCHLDYDDFAADFDAVLARAREAGVTRFVSIGTRLDSSRRAVELAEKYEGVYAAVGVHPTEADGAPEDFIDQLRPLARHPKVVAIGECGFDYHYLPSLGKKSLVAQVEQGLMAQSPEILDLQMADDAVKNQQAIVFRQQMDLAAELGLNVVIHQRDSWADTLAVVNDYNGKVRTVFHCFGGTIEEAGNLLKNGHLVSFTGIATFKNAGIVHATIKEIPSNGYMVETDCPYLAPMPHRGKRCEPAYTRLVADRIAFLRGVSVETVAAETEATANAFFRFNK